MSLKEAQSGSIEHEVFGHLHQISIMKTSPTDWKTIDAALFNKGDKGSEYSGTWAAFILFHKETHEKKFFTIKDMGGITPENISDSV
jgi:hypothetical protein